MKIVTFAKPDTVIGYSKTQEKHMKVWKIVFYTIGLIPWTFIISLMAFYFHAGQLLGHLPKYDQPDPRKLSIYNDYSPYVDLTGAIWLFSLIAWILLVVTYLVAKRKNIDWTPVLISGIGHLFGILLFMSGVMEWYGD